MPLALINLLLTGGIVLWKAGAPELSLLQ
jgi:hypothetical protein